MSKISKNDSRQDAKTAKIFLGDLGVFAYTDVGEGPEQAVPAHPALTAFVHPCTADAEALRETKKSLFIVIFNTVLAKC